jgi:hypothetical protein
MENRLIITSLCAAALVYACGPWVHSQAASATPAARAGDSRTASARKVPATVATELHVARAASHVDFALHVTNNTRKTVELRFPSGRTHDFAVLDSTGKTIWRASAGRLFTQTMQALTVKASDALTMEDTWNTNGAHGQFTAVALLATETHPVERRVSFILP